jgi:hypothetical protein
VFYLIVQSKGVLKMDCQVKKIIDETSEAFSGYDMVNADYASFAAMALGDFKLALGSADLTAQDLRRILRHGQSQHIAQIEQTKSWSSFMASYVMQNANDKSVQ